MDSIFKTGTFLTANNLNLAQKVIGISSGVYSGCTVKVSSWDKNILVVDPGIAKLPDGTIISFDGSDTIDISSIPNNTTYYVCVIKYSDYSLALDIVQTLPEYTYLKIANVTKKDSETEIINSYIIKEDELKQFIDTKYLYDYFTANRLQPGSEYYNNCNVEKKYDDYDIEYLKVSSKNAAGNFQAEARCYFAFSANSSISRITLCGSISGNNAMIVYVYSNKNRVSYLLNITESIFNSGTDLVIEIPSDTIIEGDAVSVQIITTISDQGSYAEFNLNQIIIN